MTAKDAIKLALDNNHSMFIMFLADLGDADLLVRPVPGANHIAWQVGHLIVSEVKISGAVGSTETPLPSGFVERHSKPGGWAWPSGTLNAPLGGKQPRFFCRKGTHPSLEESNMSRITQHVRKKRTKT